MTQEYGYTTEPEELEGAVHKHNCDSCLWGQDCQEINERYKDTEERSEFVVDQEIGCDHFDQLVDMDNYFSDDYIIGGDINRDRINYREEFYQYVSDFN